MCSINCRCFFKWLRSDCELDWLTPSKSPMWGNCPPSSYVQCAHNPLTCHRAQYILINKTHSWIFHQPVMNIWHFAQSDPDMQPFPCVYAFQQHVAVLRKKKAATNLAVYQRKRWETRRHYAVWNLITEGAAYYLPVIYIVNLMLNWTFSQAAVWIKSNN